MCVFRLNDLSIANLVWWLVFSVCISEDNLRHLTVSNHSYALISQSSVCGIYLDCPKGLVILVKQKTDLDVFLIDFVL